MSGDDPSGDSESPTAMEIPSDPPPRERIEGPFQRIVELSEFSIEALELLTAVVLVGLFAIGLFDLLVQIAEAFRSGGVFRVENVVGFIDTVLVLLILAEVFRTVIAFAREESVIRIIIDAAVIAITRKVISFRPSTYETTEALFTQTIAIALLLTVLVGAFYVVRQVELREAAADHAAEMPASGHFDPAKDDDD